MHSAQIYQKRVEHQGAAGGSLLQKPGQLKNTGNGTVDAGRPARSHMMNGTGVGGRAGHGNFLEPAEELDLYMLEKELKKRENGLIGALKTEADLQDDFRFYIPESREQQPFIFYKIDEKGDVIDTVEMFAEKTTSEDRNQAQVEEKKASSTALLSLLTVDVESKLREWEEEKRRKVAEEMDKLEEEYERAQLGEEENLIEAEPHKSRVGQRPGSEPMDKKSQQSVLSQASSTKSEKKSERQLWVDKYAPTSYFDLLTPEAHNRNLLTWLKSWDEIVFPERAQDLSRSRIDEPNNAGGPFFRKTEAFVNFDLAGKAHHATAPTEYSYHNKRMLMLNGPPGTGKSTLAKLLAKHCGYQSRHINASDMRSADQLLHAIRNAMTTDSHFDRKLDSRAESSSKPCCIIIDEVDGAASGGMGTSSSADGALSSARGFAHVVQVLQSCIQYSNGLKSKQKEDELDEVAEEPGA